MTSRATCMQITFALVLIYHTCFTSRVLDSLTADLVEYSQKAEYTKDNRSTFVIAKVLAWDLPVRPT
jgi:hypothetical protein